MFWRAGDYVDKILRGAKPADIPVEQLLRLPRKLEPDPRAPRVIQTERGVGYEFAVPVEHV